MTYDPDEDGSKDAVTIEDVTCDKDTKLACLVDAPVLGAPVWIPKSQIKDDSEVYKEGTSGKLVIPRWLAEAKGLV